LYGLVTNIIYLNIINKIFIIAINKMLGIDTLIIDSSELEIKGDKTEKLVNICRQRKANKYLSGPAAVNYIDMGLMKHNNIKIEWMDYNNYPEYDQLYPPFKHNITILDLIFNEGKNAINYIKSFKNE